jgi:hypothetical protein
MVESLVKGKQEDLSCFSGRHFGHYIAGLRLDHVTVLHALVATIITKRGIVLDR